MSADRILAYRDMPERTAHSEQSFQYLIANQALDEVRIIASRGTQPTDSLIDGVKTRFNTAAAANEEHAPFVHYRSRLLGAYVLPIVFADVVNIGLTDSQARHVAEKIQLAQSYDESLLAAKDALEQYDILTDPTVPRLPDRAHKVPEQLSGFLHEVTMISLVNRNKSAKRFAVPTTAYDDQLIEHGSLKADGVLYDQRTKGYDQRKNPFQVKSSATDKLYEVPVITGYDMANQPKASAWPHDDEKFTTLRKLIHENNGDELSTQSLSTLDRLSGFVIRKVLRSNS